MALRKKYKVKVVNSYKQFPKAGRDKKIRGYSDPKTGNVWIKKGTPKYVVEHELYHSMKRHPDKPRKYKDYLNQELEADKYAYDKTKQPKGMVRELTMLFNESIPYIQKKQATPKQVINHMKRNLKDSPKNWQKAVEIVRKKARKKGWKA